MSEEKSSDIETEINEILGLLPTEQDLIVATRYQGGLNAVKQPIAQIRERLEKLQVKLKEKS